MTNLFKLKVIINNLIMKMIINLTFYLIKNLICNKNNRLIKEKIVIHNKKNIQFKKIIYLIMKCILQGNFNKITLINLVSQMKLIYSNHI